MLDIFGRTGGKSSQESIPIVKLAVIGTGNSGKTYLLNAIHRLIFGGITLKNGLSIGAQSAQDTTVKFREIETNIKLMQKDSLPRTTMKYDFDFCLWHRVKQVVHIVYHDSVGQILTDPDPKRNASRGEFLKVISQATVVWLLLPMQVDKNGEYIGINHKDVELAKGYLRDALQNRASPLAFAILLTKADVLNNLEQEPSKQELHKLHVWLKNEFGFLTSNDFISVAALFPISTLGFDNAQLVTNDKDETVDYILRGNDLKPYNVDKLLLWSLTSACYQSSPADSATQVDDVVKRELLNNLHQLEGLNLALKEGGQ